MMVIPQKLKEKVQLKERFVALDKYFRRPNNRESTEVRANGGDSILAGISNRKDE